jgi:hypothetical protein
MSTGHDVDGRGESWFLVFFGLDHEVCVPSGFD